MTAKTKKLLITTEKHEVFVVRLSNPAPIHGFCPNCGAEVEMLTLDSALRVSESSGREVIRRLAAEEIHTIETDNGRLLVCRNSLQTSLQQDWRR
jgi:hypothetical protein